MMRSVYRILVLSAIVVVETPVFAFAQPVQIERPPSKSDAAQPDGNAAAADSSSSQAQDESLKRRRLLERDQLSGEAEKHRAEGRFGDAITVGRQILAIDREFLSANDGNIETTLTWLAEVAESAEDWKQAEAFRREIVSWSTLHRGPDHWMTLMVRLALAKTTQIGSFPVETRRRLATADQFKAEALGLHGRGQYAEALKKAAQACELRKEILGAKHPDYATDLHNLAALCEATANYSQAEPFYVEALSIRKSVYGVKHPGYAVSLSSLAVLLRKKGEFARALPLSSEALAVRREVLGERHPHYLTSLSNTALLYEDIGDYAAAEKHHLAAMTAKKETLGAKHPDFAISLNNLAMFHQNTGNYRAAEPLFREARTIIKDTLGPRHPAYATSLNNLGGVYVNLGDYARAEPFYAEALAIVEDVLGKKHSYYAATLNNLAQLYGVMGDDAKAMGLYQDCLEVVRQAEGPKHPNYAASLRSLAILRRKRGDVEGAKALLEQSRTILEEALGTSHPDYAGCLASLAATYRNEGDYARAEALYKEASAVQKKALGASSPQYAVSLSNLAELYWDMGDSERAESFSVQARALTKEVLGDKHLDYAMVLANAAFHLSVAGRSADAAPLFCEAVAISRAALDATAAVQSERSQLTMSRALRHQLDAFISLIVNSGLHPREVFDGVLAWKGSTLMRQRGMRLSADNPEVRDVLIQLQQSAARLSLHGRTIPSQEPERGEWRERLAELTTENERLEAALSTKSAPFQQARKNVTLDDLLESLPKDGVLVDYLEFERSSTAEKNVRPKWQREIVAFVVRHADDPSDCLTAIGLGPVAPVKDAIDAWRQTYGAGDPAIAAGRVLRSKIWEPLLPAIGDAKTILVSTDGVLGRIPLTALPGKTRGSYLIEDHRLAMIPVPRLLPDLIAAEADQKSDHELLLLGNVDYDAGSPEMPQTLPDGNAESQFAGVRAPGGDSDRFEPLSGTKVEIESIRRVFAEAHPTNTRRIAELSTTDATEARFRREAVRSRYLHLATHGFFAPARFHSALSSDEHSDIRRTLNDPTSTVVGYSPNLLSGLAMAGANRPPPAEGDDGILTAEEIACLPLGGARLVTLSACETGLGETAGGEGLLGLQRAFQVSGARTTIASYWKVDDQATAALMQLFYENLWKKKQSALDALRNAQLTLLHDASQIEAAALRGPGQAKPLPGGASAADPSKTPSRLTDVRRWAAFTLSGDWR
jgi:CHAT domain-containing protein/tetratricopeptide (TPR) repeat protein